MGGGRAGRAVVVLLVAVCALTGGGPPAPVAQAAPAVPAQALSLGSGPAGSSVGRLSGRVAAPDSDSIETARSSRPVAPGVHLTSYERLRADSWLRVAELDVDLHGSGVRADYLSSGRVTDRRPLSALAAAHDPGTARRTVAAVNADFFDIQQTGAPQGPGIKDGALTHSPAQGAGRAAGIGPEGAGRILELYFEGTLRLPSGPHPLAAHNAADVPPGGIGLYTPAWGEADRALTVDTATPVAEVVVSGGRVRSVTDAVGTGPIAEHTAVLVAREEGAALLAALRPGDPVSWEYRPVTDSGPVPQTAVGGRELLVVDGVAQRHSSGDGASAPRTAVGFSRDGRRMHVVTVDGRQAGSGGATLTELGRMMRRAGAYNALNLDGGGSSTLVAREPGARCSTW